MEMSHPERGLSVKNPQLTSFKWKTDLFPPKFGNKTKMSTLTAFIQYCATWEYKI